ncbi:CRISPR-associated protein Cas2 [Candidatus Peregrinibacteria bacterium CG_4_10_14_0_2_um_filter_43_11]|nr:MAG: CRISPR-associated protein Cas2 [Candidatus Peregrinibacteria bacterium CG_4_10_14_0_2_um_filter_43_11]
MNCYIITYDLKNSDANDYSELFEAIKSYKTWAHINESVWAIVTEEKAKIIRDFLKEKMDSEDSLFVVKSGTEAAWSNVLCKKEWLKNNL